MDLVSWYVGIVVAQAEEATQDGALDTVIRNRLVESGPGQITDSVLERETTVS